MKITDILSSENIIINESIESKRAILEKLSDMASMATNIDKRLIFDALIERERLGTTALGHGIAVPHTRLSGLNDIYAAFVKSTPLDFDAADGLPVDLLFLLLVPESSGGDHLKALSCISTLLRDSQIADKLRHAISESDLFSIIKLSETEIA